MKRFILLLCLLALFNCKKEATPSQDLAFAEITEVPKLPSCYKGGLEYSLFDQPDIRKELYAVKFSAIAKGDTQHDLVIDMHLKDGGHFVSPNATGNFSGKFTMVIDDTEAFQIDGKLIETPLTVEEIDLHPFVNGPVNWVRENTTYTQQIKLLTENSFEVHGYIQFTIEPACTLEKIPFIIKHQDGVLKFEFFGC